MNHEDWTIEAREALALRVREHIVRMATGGGCFIGASLSCADLLTTSIRQIFTDRSVSDVFGGENQLF